MADYLPIEKIANGIIYTDHRFVKVVEVSPHQLHAAERPGAEILSTLSSHT
ncbi:MAG: hypothetical protein ACLRJV_19140 [Eubacteriales bacterium]